MGDRKAMEVAQAVHQHIHLRVGSLEAESQLTHGWGLPGRSAIWGSYCDDLALVDLLHDGLRGENAPQRVKQRSEERLGAVKQRYGEVGLQLKHQKEQLRQSEAVVWGAALSSSRRDIRGDLTKMKALVFLTVEVLRARVTTTHFIQRVRSVCISRGLSLDRERKAASPSGSSLVWSGSPGASGLCTPLAADSIRVVQLPA
eukprot:1267896-Amphidinium_carterae.2